MATEGLLGMREVYFTEGRYKIVAHSSAVSATAMARSFLTPLYCFQTKEAPAEE